MNIRVSKDGKFLFCFSDHDLKSTFVACLATSNEVPANLASVFRSVLHDNREMITRPAITLIPSIFSLSLLFALVDHFIFTRLSKC
jgi:hypothetical protein